MFLNEQWLIFTDHITMQETLHRLSEDAEASNEFSAVLNAAQKTYGDQDPVKISFRSLTHRHQHEHNEQLSFLKQKYANTPAGNQKINELITTGVDEYGIYDQLETKGEVTVAVRQLFVDFIEMTLGTHIEMTFVEGRHLRRFGQYYRSQPATSTK